MINILDWICSLPLIRDTRIAKWLMLKDLDEAMKKNYDKYKNRRYFD